MTATPSTAAPASRVHGGAFPHPADCRECQREHRCAHCGNSKGYGSKAHYRHGPGRCEPITAPAENHSAIAEKARDRAEGWLYERITATRAQRPRGGVCGFRSLDELRAFTLAEAQAALGSRPLNLVHQLVLESAVRNLHNALGLLCSVLEVHKGRVPDGE